MANWLESDARPISAGWGPEPNLSAPPIGELVKGILANRLGQQKLTQDTLSDAIKAQQSRNQDAAFAQALQNAGLTQGQDISGVGGTNATRLAQLIAQNAQDKDVDALHQAAAARDNALADAIKNGTYGRGASTGVDFSEHPIGDTWIDPGTGITMYQTRTGPRPFASTLQPSTTRTQNQNQLLSEQNKLLTQQGMLSQQSAAEQQQNMAAKKPNVPFSQADLYNRNAARLQELQRQLTMPHADQPNAQTDTGDQQDQSQTSGGGAAPPAGQDPAKRQQAITILQQNNQPATEPNIAHVVGQLN
jgi:hypothetical protein